MCTLISLWQCHPSAPLILALNRDEFLGRPTRAPEFWEETPPHAPIVAGRDLQGGGTWFGIGRHVVAGLTNHRRPDARSGPSSGELSRGELVVDALGRTSALEACEALLARPGENYGPFHLQICDLGRMFWITNRNGPMEARAVEPGLHVLGNYGLDNEGDPVVETLHHELRDAPALDERLLETRLKETLATHGKGRPCVHYNEIYGTRSSALLWWGRAPNRYWVTDGPPCRTPWTDNSDLLRMLGRPTAPQTSMP